MKPGARLQTAIELLDDIEAQSGKPADAVMSDGLRQRRYAGSKDRSAIAETVYGVLRCRAQVDWWLSRGELPATGRSRALTYTVLSLGDEAGDDILSDFVEQAAYGVDPPDAAEQAWLEGLRGQGLNHPDQPIWVAANLPDWFVSSLEQQYGDDWRRQAAALSAEAPVDVRVNLLKADREAVAVGLAQEGIETAPCALSPVGLRLTRRRPLRGTKVFKEGWIEVQDEGSQLVALLTHAKPGMKVVDFCAGAGGKTLALAAGMENKGRIVACDTSEMRLSRAADRLERAGSFIVERRVLSSARDKWVKRRSGRFDGGFDRVLVDAPCTGSGTWRRNPDQKWRIGEGDVAELTALQSEILSSAARLVAPGGRLVYATCSLLKAENEDRIESFLAERQDFFRYPIEDVWAEAVGGACPMTGDALQLSPAEHGTDGFYCAVLGRKLTA
ncbi:RsmB/NOP family class I SAM-dependent RNA methyltransferase [Hwanghaeella sp.]|uniref:RsmB/NOP family class I SAM-dependent RNA methyltransferase n=1 Tax=Hwanghaeella sp. TaxID=2605943 RepID=UPI003CCC1F5A